MSSEKPSSEELQRYRDAFDLINTGDDDVLSCDELVLALRWIGYNPSNEEVRKAIKSVDRNDDGVLDFEEFCDIVKKYNKFKPLGVQEEMLRKAFAYFDTDNNGYLTKDELEKAMLNLGEKLTLRELDTLLSIVDTNGDGVIDLEEFVTLMNSL